MLLGTFDRYVIRKYLTTFFFTALLFSIIAITIDFSEKVGKFVDKPVTTMEIIREYYLNYIPYINGLLWPIFALISVIFFTSRLARNTEVVAMLGAGMSYLRFLRSYLVSAAILAGMYLLGSHIIFPAGNKTMLAFENKYIHPNNYRAKTSNLHLFIGPQTKVYIANYQPHDSSGTGFRMERFNDLQLEYVIKAKSFRYLPEEGRWRLRDYEEREWIDGKEELRSGRGQELDTAIALYPSDFFYYINDREMMTSAELLEHIRFEQERGLGSSRIMRSEYHRRWAEPFTIIILTLIGAAIASRKNRGGTGMNLALGVAVGALYIFTSKFAMTFSTNLGVWPMLAMWMPNIAFGGLAWYLISKAQQ